MSRTCITATILISVLSAAWTLPAQRGVPWTADVVIAGDAKLRSCAIGDVLPDRRGNEIVVVGTDGTVLIAYRDRAQWKHERIHRAAGPLVGVAIGDVLPDRPGNEILVVGAAGGSGGEDGPGAVIVLHRTSEGWRAETAFTSDAFQRGVCLASGEAFVTGADAALRRLCHEAGGAWRAERLAGFTAPGESVTAIDGALVVACADGTLVAVERSGDGWRSRPIGRRSPSRSCVGTDGRRLVRGDEDGTVSLLTRNRTDAKEAWRCDPVGHDDGRVTASVLADLVPERPGLEIATAGQTGRVTLLSRRGERWRRTVLFQGDAPLPGLAAGELDGRPGLELAACSAGGRLIVLRREAQRVLGPQAGEWCAEVALDLGIGIGGCAVGDLLAERPGDEIVAVSRDGAVHVVRREGDDWVGESVYRAPGEMIQVAIGDVDPRSPGNEIIAVGVAEGAERSGGPGAAVIVRRTSTGWSGEPVFTASALLHGACAFEGAAFVTGYDRAVHRLRFVGGKWSAEKVVDLPGPGKQALPTPAGVVIACRDGALVRVERVGDAYRLVTLDRRPSGRSRLGTDGTRIIVSDDDGTLSILSPGKGGAAWSREEIHREFDLQRGAVLADLDPDSPGLEAATAGYEFKVTLLRRAGGHWWSRMLYRDSDRLHHLAAGDVDGRPGLELVTCGYSGRLTVLRRVATDL